MGEKTVNTFQLRREIDRAVAALAECSSEVEQVQSVEAIVRKHPSTLILPALRKHLNSESSQMRGGLGRLAARLPHDESVALLRKEAGRRENATQTRLTAAMILERFLNVEVPPGLMGDLSDPHLVVKQSLQEALEAGRFNRQVLLEYVLQMRQESEEVAFLVLDLLGQLAEADQPELLRLIAYDDRAVVAEAAMARLGALRGPGVAEKSAEALRALKCSLRPDLTRVAARQLRKLSLAGVGWEPHFADGWSALISPCSVQGTQHLWLVRYGEEAGGTLIGMRINRVVGILDTFGNEEVEQTQLPPRRQVGDMLSVSLTREEHKVFLSIPYAYARHALESCLESHWEAGGRGLVGGFALFCPLIFAHSAGAVADDITELLGSGPALWGEGEEDLAQVTGTLLGHPAMAGWVLPVGDVDRSAGAKGGGPAGHGGAPPVRQASEALEAETLESVARSIAGKGVPKGLAEQLRRALLAQAGWLHIAGQKGYARRAVYAAESLRHLPLHSHPLLLQMIALGFRDPEKSVGGPGETT
ncbi:MAG: hypothetical protein OXF62_10600 [Caldilineaceae bacterium]|nr:hypothetical protein [Caldilineaceae bacterium]